MAIKLTVVEPFGSYQKGDEITDTKTVRTVLDGGNAAHVLSVQVPDAPKASKAD